MKEKPDLMKDAEKIIDTAIEANIEKCTCGSDPESGCGFCSKSSRALRLLEKLQTELGLDF